MTWTKLGDEFAEATYDLTDAEFRTHVEALLWSNRRLLDLHIPKRDLRRFVESGGVDAAVDGLAVKGWWEDRGDTWYIGLRFAHWQDERDLVEHRQSRSALRSKRWRRHRVGDHSLCVPGRCPQAVTRDATGDATRSATREEQRHDTPSSDPSRPRDGSETRPFNTNGTRDPLEGDAVASIAESLPRCEHGMVGGNLPNPLREDKGRKCPQCRQDAVWASSEPAPKGTER